MGLKNICASKMFTVVLKRRIVSFLHSVLNNCSLSALQTARDMPVTTFRNSVGRNCCFYVMVAKDWRKFWSCVNVW